MRRLGLLLAVALLAACRTPVAARPKPPVVEKDVYVNQECSVHDYPGTTDVPEGAKNLGMVRVAKVKDTTDDEMYLLLREAVCAAGGDALSGLRWVKELGKISGAPTDLEANAWLLAP